MDAVAGIAERIWQIQSRIAQLAPPVRVTVGSSSATGSAGEFAAVLAATGTTGTAGTAAVASGADRLNANGVPVDLVGYGNGRIPSEALSTISGTSAQLWTPAARSFEALRSAAAADGVTIGITDSYRTYESQVDVAARKGLYRQGGLAATPGTSMHGWGMALDLRLDSTAQAWMRAHGEDYGFVEDVAREPWHWGYHPTT